MKVNAKGQHLTVEGPKGKLDGIMPPHPKLVMTATEATVEIAETTKKSEQLHGLGRTLLANMIDGVTTGFTKTLEINGVGYRAEVKGQALNLTLGFSHPVVYQLPKGIVAEVEKQTKVTIKGADKQMVGLVAAQIRALKPPEPYQGKGIKYSEEVIRRKEGKAGTK